MQNATLPTSIFLFHRDLRLADNTALIKLIKSSGERVLPVFICDPVQIDRKRNAHFSNPAVQFMCESLVDLDKQLQEHKARLHIYYGSTLPVLKALRKELPSITKIAWNEDLSDFSNNRDDAIKQWALRMKWDVVSASDYYLTEADEGMGPSGPYKVLSAFWKWFLKANPTRIVDQFKFDDSHFAHTTSSPTSSSISDLSKYYSLMPELALHGGRTLGIIRLKNLDNLKNYEHDRNFPAKTEGTSRLSPYLKFGCVSIREAYWRGREALGAQHPFIRELVFRDFYAKVYSTKPELQTGKTAVLDGLDKHLDWYMPESKPELWKAWTTGNTGIPLVDAGMRELITTGHQHNRVRMLCASVLSKYMWIDWRAGAKFYYTHLVDADIFSNTAGWGFSSSTGVDAVPYFRAPFNPFIQSKKFDPDAEYIKRWVPELSDIPAKLIHKWGQLDVPATQYPFPIINCKEASSDAVARFKKAAKKN